MRKMKWTKKVSQTMMASKTKSCGKTYWESVKCWKEETKMTAAAVAEIATTVAAEAIAKEMWWTREVQKTKEKRE